MNMHAPQAQKQDRVMTFYVILMFVASIIAFASYITIQEVIPAIHNFTEVLQTPHKAH